MDQFLEGVIHSGLSALEVVRVGGRSKSAVLQQRNLQDLAQVYSPTEAYRLVILISNIHSLHFVSRRGELKREAQKLEQEITEYTLLKQKKRLGYYDIKPYLKYQFPEQYKGLAKKAAKGEHSDKDMYAVFYGETESVVYDISLFYPLTTRVLLINLGMVGWS